MEKTKLMEMRKSKRIPQEKIAEYLNMSVSCYNRRERGLVYIKNEEWEKLAKILNVPVDDIYESDETHSFICNDNASATFFGTNHGTNNIYTVPKDLLETQQKYIAKLEEEIKELKKKIK